MAFKQKAFWATQGGFTLVERIVVLAIIGVILVASVQLLAVQRVNEFNSEVAELLSGFRTTQSNARTVLDNKEYGISFTTSSWTTYTIDPATGTKTNIRTYQLSRSTLTASFSGATPNPLQITFARLTGLPDTSNATITLTRKSSSQTKVVTVNSNGTVYGS